MPLAVALLVTCIFSTPAFAYLDPGSGSILAQAAIALLLGAAFQIKFIWRKIKEFFGTMISRKKRGD